MLFLCELMIVYENSIMIWFSRKFGMPRFLTHDSVSSNVFNSGHCSATGIWIPWKAELTNTVPLLRLLVNRLEKDWVALPVKQRRPWNQKEVESQLNVRLTLILGPDTVMGRACRASMISARLKSNQGDDAAFMWSFSRLLGSIYGCCPIHLCGHLPGGNPQNVSQLTKR